MWSYSLRRLLQSIIVLLALSFVIYIAMTLMPGDPLDALISSNPHITSADVERLREIHGLNKPGYVRYFMWLQDAMTGNFGYSRTYKVEVLDVIGPRLMNTFYLSLASLTLSITLGIVIGIISGLRPGSKFDYIVNLFTFGGISLPSFWLGILLIILFAVNLQLLPASGTETIGLNATGLEAFFDRIRYLILPTISLSVIQAGRYVRFTRSAVVEAMRNDFIRTARAKGLSQSRITIFHGFRNALIPVITVVTLSFSGLFSGATITEIVFSYQGVGKLVYDSVMGNDYNVAMVAFMIGVSMVLIMNLIGDLLYAVADPRISYR